ncbi:hypothetical protein QQF64_008823 [Cirrhinus molitorella]|uniref:Inositol polyphosphate-related phosphatase domain-containing protein n=1 Tax=Cirrhinus molitorella TaxID=172907 RepID=A0ABR3M9P5_9TELE
MDFETAEAKATTFSRLERMEEDLSQALNSVSLEQKDSTMETFGLYVVTWNVATAEPPDDVNSLLQLSSPKKPDLYVIGLQEVKAAPLKFVTDLAFEDSWSHLFMNTLAPLGYIKVSSIRMQGLLLLFFSKLKHVPFIRDIQVTYTRTGLYGYWGNKGGVSIRLSFYGHMLCFLNCHLAAHMNYASQRVDEFEYILNAQTFETKNTPRIMDHKVVFWFGDLNFRIEDHGMLFVRNCITSQRYNLLWPKDQLTMMKQKEATLQKFEEGLLDFQPTYKFDLHSDNYDTSGKKRKPAWCDRILWRVKPKSSPSEDANEDSQKQEEPNKHLQEEFPLKLSQEYYTSKMEYGISDHKPVIGTFCLELRKMYETPLVQVCAEGEWSADFDALITYSLLQSFPSSAWDWIGLYKVGFKSVSDYITYTWVKDDQVSLSDELFQVYVNKDEIPVLGGECVLCYYSSNLQCIVGISQPFKVQESRAAIEEGLVPENINGLDETSYFTSYSHLHRHLRGLREKMSRLMGPPDKFLPSEWKHANQVHFRSSEAERSQSQRLTAECQRLIEESDKSTKRMQQDAQKKLEQRIQDIKFWRQELDQKFEEMVQEIETLVIFKSRVEKAFESCSEPFQVTLQCLTERQKRVAIDLVHDEVEEELLKEKEVIEGVMVLLQRTLEQINEQIRLIRSVKYYLEKDLQDKFQAERIDDFCSLLTNSSPGLNGGNSNFTSYGIAVTPEEWENLCNLNLSKAEKEKNNSLSLRALVDSLLEQTAADMRRQYETTGRAFELRIQETKTAKAQLENQLNELLAETANQEKNLESLRVAIGEKEAPLKVAQTRLSSRSQRPNVELCHDPAQIQLLEEVKELANRIERLTEALEVSEMELKALASRQLCLEEEIQVKTNSLYIDEVICHELRQPVVIHNF